MYCQLISGLVFNYNWHKVCMNVIDASLIVRSDVSLAVWWSAFFWSGGWGSYQNLVAPLAFVPLMMTVQTTEILNHYIQIDLLYGMCNLSTMWNRSDTGSYVACYGNWAKWHCLSQKVSKRDQQYTFIPKLHFPTISSVLIPTCVSYNSWFPVWFTPLRCIATAIWPILFWFPVNKRNWLGNSYVLRGSNSFHISRVISVWLIWLIQLKYTWC